MPQAVPASQVRTALAGISGLVLPTALTDAIIDEVLQRKTGIALGWAGLTDLPAAGPLLSAIQDAVFLLGRLEVERQLRPDSVEFLRALAEQEGHIQGNLRGFTQTPSGALAQAMGTSGAFIDILGGPDDG